ncbi:MAG TPA: hypothetical protein VIF62_22905 [Labilithrix sp.]
MRRLLVATALGSLAFLAHEPRAGADPRKWYGGETLAIDGASAAMIGGSYYFLDKVAREHDATGEMPLGLVLGVFGGLGYLLGGPIVHWERGRTGIGFADLGSRVALPLAGLGVGALVGGVFVGDNTTSSLVGLIGGAVAAIALDAAFFAFDPTPLASTSSSSAALVAQPRVVSFGGAF